MKLFFERAFHEAGVASPAPRPVEILSDLLSTSVAFDLETSSQAVSHSYLRDAAAFPADLPPEEAEKRRNMSARAVERELRRGRFVIGHNAVVHDIPELETFLGRNLDDLQVIDTIWLSPLAFPDRASHALKKPYLSGTSLADPVKDTLETLELLKAELAALSKMDREWLEILRWLCGLGSNHAGYAAFFDLALGRTAQEVSHNLEAARSVIDAIARLFQGEVCMRGLNDQLAQAFQTKNGWPLAWSLSWVRHRADRPAPAEWLLKGDLGFQEALDDLGRRRCSQPSCRRCRKHETSLDSINCQSARNSDPLSASNFDPPVLMENRVQPDATFMWWRRDGPCSELQTRFLKRQDSLPVSTISQW